LHGAAIEKEFQGRVTASVEAARPQSAVVADVVRYESVIASELCGLSRAPFAPV